jgi:hypothetical protein
MASVREKTNARSVLVVKLAGNGHFEGGRVDGRLILKLSSINRMGGL